MYRQFIAFEFSEGDRNMGESARGKHVYKNGKDDDILRTTFDSWKKKKKSPKNLVNDFKDPVHNFKKWWCCNYKDEPDKKLGFLLTEWLKEKSEQINCKNKNDKCKINKIKGIGTRYKTCKSCK
jgi:hypothetical protein